GVPRMNPELAWMVAIFLDWRKLRCEGSMASASQTVRTALEGLIWRFSFTLGRTPRVCCPLTHDHRMSYASAGDGLGRSTAISRKISWNMCRGMATSAIWKAMLWPWLMTLARILISFSFRLDSDQSLIGSGVASVRRKLPRL